MKESRDLLLLCRSETHKKTRSTQWRDGDQNVGFGSQLSGCQTYFRPIFFILHFLL